MFKFAGAYGAVKIRSDSMTILDWYLRGILWLKRVTAIDCAVWVLSPIWTGGISTVLSSYNLKSPFLLEMLRLTTGAPIH